MCDLAGNISRLGELIFAPGSVLGLFRSCWTLMFRPATEVEFGPEGLVDELWDEIVGRQGGRRSRWECHGD